MSDLAPAPERVGYNPLDLLRRANEEKVLLAWVSDIYAQAKKERQQIERQWYLNLAFYFGRQNVSFLQAANGSFQLRTPSVPPWRVRMVINKIRPMVRHESAKLVAQKPIFTVVPATTEDEDHAAARVGEQIFSAIYSDKQVDYETHKAAWWASITGSGFLKTYWNGGVVTEDNQQGDIAIENVSPFHIYPGDQAEEDIRKQPYLIHASTKSKDWVKANLGQDLNSSVAAGNPLEDAFQNLVGTRTSPKDEVLIIEVWIKPGVHPMFPMGGLITVAGGKVVQRFNQFPYKHGELPFHKIDIVPTGRFFGESNVTDLIPLQREYNRTASQILEAKNLMAKPKLIAPRGSVNPRAISSEPGQVILYQPGFDPPRPLPMDSLPPYVMEQLDRIQQDMDDISGQHEISRGNTPSQVTAATAISYLQEQDDSKLAYAITSVERAVQGIGRQCLKYVEQFWDTPRLVKVVGTDGAFEAYQWQNSSIRGNTDIRVQAGSALPQSKAAKQAFIMDLLKLGIIPPEAGLDILDIGGIEKVYENYLIDKRQAERENLKMASVPPEYSIQYYSQPNVITDPMTGETTDDPQGLAPILPPNTWDNHQAHIEHHNRFRKSQQFDMLPEVTKRIFEEHVALHQQALGLDPITGMPSQPVGPDGMMPEEQQGEAPPEAMPQDNSNQPPEAQN